ncbi:MAG: DMT family transporter [Candidatus Marinimicrobia bacterium]|nr:DMT family transporter [Candidatus Neomarinimicrobiota bacterium]
MNKKEIKTDIMLIVAALLWGLGFVAQRDGMNYIGPFFYTAIRFGIGVLCLLPIYFITRKRERKRKIKVKDKAKVKNKIERESRTRTEVERKTVLFSGLIVGVLLFLAVSAQQIGLQTTTAAKASFITALYMVLVPIFGIFLKHKTSNIIWISIGIALAGVYFMSITKDFTIDRGDLFVIACAILWAVHFLFIAHYSSRVGAIRLSLLQFLVCAILSIIVALFTEPINLKALSPALPSILYGGIGAVGIAYTLHVVALKDANPAYASLILSTESVFGALGGWLILHETMSSRQILGAILIMGAVLITQIKRTSHKDTKKIKAQRI